MFKIIEIVEGKGNDKLKFDECWYKGYYWFLGSNSIYIVNLLVERIKKFIIWWVDLEFIFFEEFMCMLRNCV